MRRLLVLAALTAAAAPAPAKAKAAGGAQPKVASAPDNLAAYTNLTDFQLDALFKEFGVAVMPSQEPNYNIPAGEPWYDFCVGRTIINAFTTKASSVISGDWPYGLAHPLNNLFQRGWWGKVFYNDGTNPDVVQLWNLLYSNGTVDFDAIGYKNASVRVTGDGEQSVFVDYATTDFAPFRTVIDEVRQVNADANIYLGHIWASNPVDALVKPGYKNPIDEAAYRAKLAALNSTWLDFVGWAGLDTVVGATDTPSDYFTLGWFVMQCIGPHAPKVKYAWTAYFLSLVNMLTGFYRPEAALPHLPFAPSSDPIEVGPGFPAPSHDAGTFPRLHIWPFKVSDIGQLGTNVSKIPQFKGEPVLGEAKLYPIVTNGVNTWFNDGKPDPSWTPTDVELKAADIAKWVNGPFAKFLNKGYAINESAIGNDVSGVPLPPDHVNPTWNAALAAIHAVEAANAAAKEALANPTKPVNRVAKLLKTGEYAAKVVVDYPDGFLGTIIRGTLADKPPRYNLTGFFDYWDRLKHQPFARLPKLNYTPPRIIWEGDFKNATHKPEKLDILVQKLNLTAWLEDLKETLSKDDKEIEKDAVQAAHGHGMSAHKLPVGSRKMAGGH